MQQTEQTGARGTSLVDEHTQQVDNLYRKWVRVSVGVSETDSFGVK